MNVIKKHQLFDQDNSIDSIQKSIRKWIDREWSAISSVDWHDMHPDSNAYNTAWVASLGEPGRPPFPKTLDWLIQNQLDDGSWGSTVCVFYDQMISTLVGIYSIHKHLPGKKDTLNAAKKWVEVNFSRIFRDKSTHNGIAFALLVPSIFKMVSESVPLNISQTLVDQLLGLWREKIQYLNIDDIMNEKNHLAYSLEFLCGFPEEEYQLDFGKLIQENGAIGNSESATAFAISICKDDILKEKMMEYLTTNQLSDGGFTSFSNLDVFNLCFLLFPIVKITGQIPEEYQSEVKEMFQMIKNSGNGIVMGRYWHSPDSDDTILALYLAFKAGLITSTDTIWQNMEYFNVEGYWYELYKERYGKGTSRKVTNDGKRHAVSVNIHVYDVLSQVHDNSYAVEVSERLKEGFKNHLSENGFGTDRWHISPAYNNCHAMIAFAKTYPEMADTCKNWFIDTQRPNGLWGDISNETAFEMCSFAVLALMYYHNHVSSIDLRILEEAIKYILSVNTTTDKLAAMWLDKVQYRPDFLVGTTIAGLLAYLQAV